MSPYLFALLPLIGAAVLLVVYWIFHEYELAEDELRERQRREHGRDESLKRLAQELPTIPDRKPTRPRGATERRRA